jgi:hypothetical protein
MQDLRVDLGINGRIILKCILKGMRGCALDWDKQWSLVNTVINCCIHKMLGMF